MPNMNKLYRIKFLKGKPIDRSFLFEAVFTSDWQSIQSLLTKYLKEQKIPYTRVLGKLWIMFNGAWCGYAYEESGDSVKFYILEYKQK